jgi:hypothetical protein
MNSAAAMPSTNTAAWYGRPDHQARVAAARFPGLPGRHAGPQGRPRWHGLAWMAWAEALQARGYRPKTPPPAAVRPAEAVQGRTDIRTRRV